MDRKKIMTVLRRAGLRLVKTNNQSLPIMKRKIPKSPESLASSVDLTISYQTLPSPEELGRNTQPPPGPDIIRRKPGPHIASSDEAMPVDLISNAGLLVIPDESTIPNEYEFEILRLRRRVESLECVVREKNARNVHAITMLEDELQMWRMFMHEHIAETHDGIRRRVLRIESTLMTLRESGATAPLGDEMKYKSTRVQE